jgi:tetratricopeptide (TPR) repeat protein
VVGRFSGAGLRRLPRARASVLCVLLVAGAPALLSADAKTALQKAAMLVQQGRLEEADSQARLALADPETRAVAYSVLGTIRVQQKKLSESALLLQKAIRLEPRLVGAHLTLAQVYTLQGKSRLALQMFTRVVELDPSNATARLALARAAMEKGDYAGSLALARPVEPAIKRSPEGLFVLVADLLKTGDRRTAEPLVKEWTALKDVPLDWSIKFALLLVDEKLARIS